MLICLVAWLCGWVSGWLFGRLVDWLAGWAVLLVGATFAELTGSPQLLVNQLLM